eukprot:TRINITY_DN59678_c0_g1_i1.p2 TRINITY_DN59678_c0_g1~~TRINITY_DN59678_c0_g1_i1.p2  ORF type:complete len:143 (-),score=11.89 TRINITY_DN59678_c0_g1_i1:27-455(-)
MIAGCVAVQAVRDIALPMLAMPASSTNRPGKYGVMYSHPRQIPNMSAVQYRTRLISLSKLDAKEVATVMRATLPRPSFSIQLIAALAASVLDAPMPREYSNDCVANIKFICEKNLCVHLYFHHIQQSGVTACASGKKPELSL